jgi:hypothetical protein
MDVLIAFLTVTGVVFWLAIPLVAISSGWLMWRAARDDRAAKAFSDHLQRGLVAAYAVSKLDERRLGSSTASSQASGAPEGGRQSLHDGAGRAGRPKLRPTPCRFCRFVRELLTRHRTQA